MGSKEAWFFSLFVTSLFLLVTTAERRSSDDIRGYVYGGTMGSTVIDTGVSGSNRFKLQITMTINWVLGHGPCGPGCSQSDVGSSTRDRRMQMIHNTGNASIFGDWERETSGKVQLITDTVNTIMQGEIAAVSSSSQWVQEVIQFPIDVDPNDSYVDIMLGGLKWRPFDLNALSPWSHSTMAARTTFQMQTKIRPGIRNDTGRPNNSPFILNQPIYRVQLDRVTEIRLTPADVDGDVVRCREARNVETSGIQPIHNVSVSEDCVVRVNAVSSAEGFRDNSWGVVNLVLEDHSRDPITMGHNVLKALDAKSLSSAHLVFMVWVVAALPVPEFVSPTPHSQHVYTVYAGSTLSIPLAARPSPSVPTSKISEFRIVSLPQHPVNTTQIKPDPKRLVERVVTSTLQWPTSDSDTGVYAMQAVAIDSDGLESMERTFRVEVKGLQQQQHSNKTDTHPYFPFFPSAGAIRCLVNTTCVLPVYAQHGMPRHTIVSVKIVKSRTDLTDVTSDDLDLETVTVQGMTLYRQTVQVTSSVIGNHTVCLMATDSHRLQTERCMDVLIYPKDPCLSQPCRLGVCIPTWDTFKCSCPPSTTGPFCQDWLNPCLSAPCQNGGTCFSRAYLAAYACRCAPGYTGRDCSTLLGNCSSSPCQNGAVCVEAPRSGGIHCQCDAGFTGPVCHSAISGLFWSNHGLADGTVLHACAGSNVTFDWLLTQTNQTGLDIQWFYEGHSHEMMAVDSHGIFIVLPSFHGRAHRVSETGIVLDGVTVGDSGKYSVYVTGTDDVTGHITRVERSAVLQVAAGGECRSRGGRRRR